MLCCGPSGLSRAGPCLAAPIPLSATPGSVRLSCCFPSLPFPFPVGLCQPLSLRQPQPRCFRPRVCLCLSPSLPSPCPGVSYPCALPCSSSRIARPWPCPAGPCPACSMIPLPTPSVPALVSSVPGSPPSVLAYPVLGVPCTSWGVSSPSLSWSLGVPSMSCPCPGL